MGKFQLKLKISFIFCLVNLVACTPSTVCTNADGTSSNYSEIFGAWKMTSGYTPTRTAAELALNFQVLVIEAGQRICEYEVVNGNTSGASQIFLGQYTHNVNAKQITVQGVSNSETLSYSFSGGCTAPSMTLTSNSGTVEKYEVWSKDLTQINCGE